MAIHRILVPTDFSESAERACQTASVLARALDASIHLLHVVHLPVQAVSPEAPIVPVGFWRDLVAHAEKCVAAVRKKLEAEGVRVASEVLEDVPDLAIAAAAKRLPADLIVMGSRGLTGLKHVLLGSVAERTVRNAPCPVLTVKVEAEPLAQLRTIVVPMDFSPGALRALELAQVLAKRGGPARIILVHAYYVPAELDRYLAPRGDPLLERWSTGVIQELEHLLVRLKDAGIEAEYLAKRGTPEELIEETANQRKADLIAMGTHGRRGLSHLLLGSVAERVVREAPFPVLTTRA